MSTSPVAIEVADAIAESTRPAMGVIFEGIELSKIELDRLVHENTSLASLNRPDAVQQYISLARFLLRRHIAMNEEQMGDWRLNSKVTGNGAILLHNGLQHIRLLHHRNSATAPHAGRNIARGNYFENSDPATEPGLLVREQNLLLLWRIWNPTDSRLVHTLSKGRYRRSPRMDLDMTVTREEEDFSYFSFQGNLNESLGIFDASEIDEAELTGTDDETRGKA